MLNLLELIEIRFMIALSREIWKLEISSARGKPIIIFVFDEFQQIIHATDIRFTFHLAKRAFFIVLTRVIYQFTLLNCAS